jgi:AAHS family 4-hydroxybenzoate transporter-like MFS transporter
MQAQVARRIDAIDIINNAKLSRFQWRLFALLFAFTLCEGFDTQCIAFVAPAISKDWALSPAALGSLFSAGFVGTAIGAVAFGILSDRIGRRMPLIMTTAVFAIATGACAIATSYNALFAYRLLAGVGLGGAMCCALALASEYAPERIRATVVAVCLWGFPVGAFLGGVFAGDLITFYGWPSIFYLGAVLPLLLLPVLLVLLPESIRCLILGGAANGPLVAQLLARIDPDRGLSGTDQFYLAEPITSRGSTAALFRDGLGIGTSLLWVACFCSCILIYCLINWIPYVLNQAGNSIRVAAFGTGIFNFAGIAGSYLISRLMRRRPLRAIAAAYVVGAVAVGLIGVASHEGPLALVIISIAGFFAIGAQISLTAFAFNYYPTSLRSTGGGWYQAISRVGSIAGPMIGGAVLAATGQPTQMFLVCAIPALAAGLTLLVLSSQTKPAEVTTPSYPVSPTSLDRQIASS